LDQSSAVLIVGASVRAASASAVRAGWKVYAVDLYGDADLCSIADSRTVPHKAYTSGIAAIARSVPPSAWMYTGAIENHSAAINQISQNRVLWGNTAAVNSRLRNPEACAAAFQNEGLPCPQVTTGKRETGAGMWLCKPFESAGGSGISYVAAEEHSTTAAADSARCYFQQYIQGESYSGAFLMADGRAVLLGVTRQLHGADCGGSSRFAYAGSIGPLVLSDTQRLRWQAVGETLASHFEPRGLIGVDAIQAADGKIFPVEVNPRFTASMELYDTPGCNMAALHIAACREHHLPQTVPLQPQSGLRGKAIVYARQTAEVSPAFTEYCFKCNSSAISLQVADIPKAGQQLVKSQPVATVFAEGATVERVQRQLRRRAESLLDHLSGFDRQRPHQTDG